MTLQGQPGDTSVPYVLYALETPQPRIDTSRYRFMPSTLDSSALDPVSQGWS
jgi:hypothetical protein